MVLTFQKVQVAYVFKWRSQMVAGRRETKKRLI